MEPLTFAVASYPFLVIDVVFPYFLIFCIAKPGYFLIQDTKHVRCLSFALRAFNRVKSFRTSHLLSMLKSRLLSDKNNISRIDYIFLGAV